MKLLFDEHLSRKLVRMLAAEYPGSAHARGLPLQSFKDTPIWDYAKTTGYVIVTKDVDFRVLSFARGHPPKIILLRTGNGPSTAVALLLRNSRERIAEFLADKKRSLLELP